MLAIAALIAVGLGRVVGPSLRSVGVGMDVWVRVLGRAGDVASQVFAFAAMVLAIVSVLAVSRTRLPIGLRIAALTLGGFAVLPTVWALHEQVPELSAGLVAASASILALCAVPTALRAPYARAAGMVIGLVALGSLVRLASVWLAFDAVGARAYLGPIARGVATAGFLCDGAAIAVAIAWIGSRSGRLTSPPTLVAFVVALILTRLALGGKGGDAGPVELFAWRAAARLMSRPEAAVPLALSIFVAFLAPLCAAAALLARGVLAPLGASIALALIARGAVEMPPCALMLLVGALGAALTARDGRGLWAALGGLGQPHQKMGEGSGGQPGAARDTGEGGAKQAPRA